MLAARQAGCTAKKTALLQNHYLFAGSLGGQCAIDAASSANHYHIDLAVPDDVCALVA
jgi:hypothetical protein